MCKIHDLDPEGIGDVGSIHEAYSDASNTLKRTICCVEKHSDTTSKEYSRNIDAILLQIGITFISKEFFHPN